MLNVDFLTSRTGLTYGLRRHSLACPADMSGSWACVHDFECARPYARTELYLIVFSVDSRVFREARVRRGLWQDGDGFRMR